jgi:hypothetical protein
VGCKVEIEALKMSTLIPQCKRCQAFGHTQKYCNKECRCVKCAGKHQTKDCKKTAEEKPKCIHCGEDHPASYRGCTIAIELQKIRNNTLKQRLETQRDLTRVIKQQPTTTATHPSADTVEKINTPKPKVKRLQSGLSFAQAVKGKPTQKPAEFHEANEGEVQQMLQLILFKLEKQESVLSAFDTRLKRLESSNATTSTKNKQK